MKKNSFKLIQVSVDSNTGAVKQEAIATFPTRGKAQAKADKLNDKEINKLNDKVMRSFLVQG